MALLASTRSANPSRNLNGSKDVIEGLFGNDPDALMAVPVLFLAGNGGLRSAPSVLVCAVKNASRFIEDGNQVHVRGENLMIQTQTASACELIKNKLSMVNEMTNHQRPNHARERARGRL